MLSVLAFVGGGVLSGCASSEEDETRIGSVASNATSTTPRYLGTIANGETKSGFYYNPPKYRAYGFTAEGGDEITVDVSSVDGDAMGWITDANYNVFAYNDDAEDPPGTNRYDAQVKYTVPAGTPSSEYRIVFRDYNLEDATFTVTLNVGSSSCNHDGQTYTVGESFPDADGCNTCSCTSSGVSCTLRVCSCNPVLEPHRIYYGNPITCQTIRFTCTFGTRSFVNACGCGCERI